MSNTESVKASTELQYQTIIIQSGDKLWDVLQSLKIHPRPDMQILWKRNKNTSKVPLTSDEWRYLPVGATLTVNNGEIVVENPNYEPELTKKNQYKPSKPKINKEDMRQANIEKDNADTILQTDLEEIEENEKDIATTKVLLESQIQHENQKLRNLNKPNEKITKLIKENQELFSTYGNKMAEIALLKRKFMGYPDLKERIDNFHEAQGYNLYSNSDKTVRIEQLQTAYDFFKSLEKELMNYQKSEAQKEAETVFHTITEKWYNKVFLFMENENKDIWNELIKRGDIKKLKKDFHSKLIERFKENPIETDMFKNTLKKLEQNENPYLENDFLYNYVIGKFAKNKSVLLYKMYLLGVFDGGS